MVWAAQKVGVEGLCRISGMCRYCKEGNKKILPNIVEQDSSLLIKSYLFNYNFIYIFRLTEVNLYFKFKFKVFVYNG